VFPMIAGPGPCGRENDVGLRFEEMTSRFEMRGGMVLSVHPGQGGGQE
jgi:hypothetical protein